MDHRRVGHVRCARRIVLLRELPRLVCRPTERDHGLDLSVAQQGGEPAVAVRDEIGILSCLALDGPIDAVEEGIDEHVAANDPELLQQALYTAPGFADEDAPDHGLVLRWILTEDEDPRRAIEPPAMEDRTPLDTELVRRIDIRLGVVSAQSQVGLRDIARVEW